MVNMGATTLAAATLLALCACSETQTPVQPETAPTGLDQRAKGCGVNYSHNYQNGGVNGYGTTTSAKTLDELRARGIRSLTLLTFAWMSSLTDARLQWRTDSAAGESFDRVRTFLIHPHHVRDISFLNHLRWVVEPKAISLVA